MNVIFTAIAGSWEARIGKMANAALFFPEGRLAHSSEKQPRVAAPPSGGWEVAGEIKAHTAY